MKELDMRHISIIDALPVYCPSKDKEMLTIGCGDGRVEEYLYHIKGYKVVATDIRRTVEWEDCDGLRFDELDIVKPRPDFIGPWPVVICSEVLEHLPQYKVAFRNLMELTDIRLIVTVPMGQAFYDPTHCNFWKDKNVREFAVWAQPYATSISKIRSKVEDIEGQKWIYLIIVDKRQLA